MSTGPGNAMRTVIELADRTRGTGTWTPLAHAARYHHASRGRRVPEAQLAHSTTRSSRAAVRRAMITLAERGELEVELHRRQWRFRRPRPGNPAPAGDCEPEPAPRRGWKRWLREPEEQPTTR